MKISRRNYELFVLDYIEGNLAKVEKDRFDRFLNENPDIKAEITGFQMVKLPVDETVRFPDHRRLIKSENTGTRRIILWRSVAAAAVFLLLLFIGKEIYDRGEVPGSDIVDVSEEKQQPPPLLQSAEINNPPLKEIIEEKEDEKKTGAAVLVEKQASVLKLVKTERIRSIDVLKESIDKEKSLGTVDTDHVERDSPLALLPQLEVESIQLEPNFSETISTGLTSFQGMEKTRDGDKLIRWFAEKSILPEFVLNLDKDDLKEALVPQYLVTD